VKSSIALGSERHVIPGVLLVHTTNSGVAFSLFAGSTIEVIATAIIVLALVFTFYGRYRAQPWLWLACGMVVGGALGNLIDRLRYGAVTDFIKLPDWPAFNVADSAITLGVVALVLIVSRGEATRKA
jgi:signal peptidase II